MSKPLPSLAGVIQGEAGSEYYAQLAVCNVIRNRAVQQGVTAMTIICKPGQFISVDPNPGASACGLAKMLEEGTLPEDNTAGAHGDGRRVL